MSHLHRDMGWLWYWLLHFLPHSAWADWNLPELTGQVGIMVEHPTQSQPNPTLASEEMRMPHPVFPRGCGIILKPKNYEGRIIIGANFLKWAQLNSNFEFSNFTKTSLFNRCFPKTDCWDCTGWFIWSSSVNVADSKLELNSSFEWFNLSETYTTRWNTLYSLWPLCLESLLMCFDRLWWASFIRWAS